MLQKMEKKKNEQTIFWATSLHFTPIYEIVNANESNAVVLVAIENKQREK